MLVHKGKKFLYKCVNSVLSQTFDNYEIILINDGSTDKSGDIFDEFGIKHVNIHVKHQKNLGLSEARNSGMKIAKGGYIFFLDSDDHIEKDTLEILYTNLVNNKADVSIASKCFEFENSCIKGYCDRNKIYTFSRKEALAELVKQNHKFDISACGVLYCKALLSGIEFPKGKVAKDWYTTYKIYAQSKKVVFSTATKYFYYRRSNSITHYQYINLDALYGCRELCDFIIECYPQYKRNANSKYISIILGLLHPAICSKKAFNAKKNSIHKSRSEKELSRFDYK